MNVHRGDARGGVAEQGDRQLDGRVTFGVVAERRLRPALHREEHVARVTDRRGEALVVVARRRLVEADVERDDRSALRLERAEEVRVRLVRQRVAPVLGDRRIVDRDDGHLIAHRRGRDVDRLVVDRGLQGRVEDLAGQHQGADQDGDEREPSDHGPLARLTLREHLRRLLDIASRVGVKLCGRSLGESPLAGRRSRARNP